MSGKEYFEKLIHPLKENEFFNEYWESKPLFISRKDTDYYEFVTDVKEINEYLNRNDLTFPAIRLVKSGVDIPANLYSRNVNHGSFYFHNLIYNDAVFDYYNDGASILLLNPLWGLAKMGKLFKGLEAYFKFPFVSNVFISPSSEQAFAQHFDNQDLLILQIYGKKIWKVYDSPIENPTNELPIAFGEIPKPTNLILDVEINPGDLLYVPRGFAHEVITIDSSSIHVTLSLLPPKWFDLFENIKDISIHLPDFRKSYYQNNSDEIFKDKFLSNIKQISFQDMLDIDLERLIQTQLLNNENRFFDLLNFDDYEISDLVFSRRKDILFRVDKSKEYLYLFFYKKKLNFPIQSESVLQYILDNDNFKLEDLKTPNLKIESIKILVEILLKYGFLKINHEQ